MIQARPRLPALHQVFVATALLGLASGCDGGASSADTPAVSAPPGPERSISALGRLEPEDGIYRLAGPSGIGSVISELRVDEGTAVKRGQVIAVLDTAPSLAAEEARLHAELDNAKSELVRHHELSTSKVISDSLREERETRVRVAEAQLAHARAELERAHVRSPIDGRVLFVHAREGERVGEDGLVELGKTDHMFAIAEVYEDDIGRVQVGQRVHVRSPVLASALDGTVEWVHLRVAKQDALGTDPAARKDARIVEVEVRLDQSEAAAGLTNLQVEVEIEP
jgi:HlyD family secretion protein